MATKLKERIKEFRAKVRNRIPNRDSIWNYAEEIVVGKEDNSKSNKGGK